MERQCKHGEYYTVKRLKMLEWMLNRGFEPIKDIPDPNNWRYKHWIFKNSPEFEDAVDAYFENMYANK